MIWPSMRFDISLQNFKKALDIFSPQIETKRSEEYLVPREARFIISSRAKRACVTQASQGQRDFLLAINLSSLVGVRLDVIQ